MSVSKENSKIVIGTQLQKAREFVALSVEKVSDEIHVSAQLIKEWEASVSQPGLQELEVLANLYGREIDYFLRETPDPPTGVKFRGKLGRSLEGLSKDTKMVLARFDELCRAAVEFEELLGKKREVKLCTFSPTTTASIAAARLREQYNLGDGPIEDLRVLLDNAAIRIFEVPVPNDELSGFSFWHQNYGPCILVHAKDSKGRRNFTLAHELAHLLYSHGSSACYIPSDVSEIHGRIERKANQFAAELLLPKAGLARDFEKRNLPPKPSEEQLHQMAIRWGVSVQALGYRLEDLGLVDVGLTNKIVESRPTYFRRPKTPTWERRLGKSFVGTSIEAYQNNLISVGKLAHVLQLPIRKAMEIAESAGR